MDRKKRKWDVAAPAGGAAGAAPGRAGIGSTGAGVPAQYAGFVTGQGLVQQQQAAAPAASVVPKAAFTPGQPLGSDIIARAQAGAAAAMEKINRVSWEFAHGIGVDQSSARTSLHLWCHVKMP